MMPEPTPDPLEVIPAPIPPARRTWGRIFQYCFALFTLEVGLFLVIFPWTDRWILSQIQDIHPWLRDVWLDPYFRGALSGLGVVNIYLALYNLLRTLRGA